MSKGVVRIDISGGIVLLRRKPRDVTVILRDYDTDGVDAKYITYTKEGIACIEHRWEAKK